MPSKSFFVIKSGVPSGYITLYSSRIALNYSILNEPSAFISSFLQYDFLLLTDKNVSKKITTK